jgi:hypothetical protein
MNIEADKRVDAILRHRSLRVQRLDCNAGATHTALVAI